LTQTKANEHCSKKAGKTKKRKGRKPGEDDSTQGEVWKSPASYNSFEDPKLRKSGRYKEGNSLAENCKGTSIA